ARVLPSFFSLVDVRAILVATTASSALLFCFSEFLLYQRIPRGVLVVDTVLLVAGICIFRVGLRKLAEYRRNARQPAEARDAAQIPVAIIGAGEAGAGLIRELRAKPGLRLRPIICFDDNESKWGQHIHGVPITGPAERLRELPWREKIRKVIIAMPAASPKRVGELARMAGEFGMPSETIPSLDQLVAGRLKISQLRPVQIEDLLRRETVALDSAGIREAVIDKVVMVTGAGGSIGSELCRQLLAHLPRQLLLVDRSEVQLFQIEQELLGAGGGSVVTAVVADVCDGLRMQELLLRHRPSLIFHAAAHKHVPMMESQAGEAIRNNSIGTARFAQQAAQAGVERFVLISTDKAINPTSVMGASKRLAEIYLQALQVANGTGCRFSAVRFGNVLGSSGSVVPIFHKQIAAGGPVLVTHPEITRYFMTISEAVGLVLQSAILSEGGEIFVLEMGQPIKIVDLARQMIELSGYRPGEDIAIEFSGLRPGEKLFEEVSHHQEQLAPTVHPKIRRFITDARPLSEVEEFLEKISGQLNNGNGAQLKETLVGLIPEYRPHVG
ncbi:MAG: polysaccharide biosynthesis protein, partial [Verrucomicrobiales bacterium]